MLNLNWDNIDWDHFSCVDMSRKIKNELDKKFATMTGEEIVSYINEGHKDFDSSPPKKVAIKN